MTQPGEFRIRPRLGLRAWITLIVVLVVAVAILAAIAAVAIGIFLFLLPVFVVSALLYYLFPPKFRAPRNGPEDASVIDGEFRVVGTAEIERKEPEERP
ncbi:MAG TPA: hypothetical protein VHT51_04560 [Micropepsaceae bacterium]|jgi:cobalamin synthase|nr:hypothetical protein [Micropepsaceae bacterium]